MILGMGGVFECFQFFVLFQNLKFFFLFILKRETVTPRVGLVLGRLGNPGRDRVISEHGSDHIDYAGSYCICICIRVANVGCIDVIACMCRVCRLRAVGLIPFSCFCLLLFACSQIFGF